jgi:hypothetical protein
MPCHTAQHGKKQSGNTEPRAEVTKGLPKKLNRKAAHDAIIGKWPVEARVDLCNSPPRAALSKLAHHPIVQRPPCHFRPNQFTADSWRVVRLNGAPLRRADARLDSWNLSWRVRYGSAMRSRRCDLLSTTANAYTFHTVNWCRKRDSNPRPHHYE